jgi:hypothetical protein
MKAFSIWPSKVMKSKWRVGRSTDPTSIISEATGHNFIDVGCEGFIGSEKNIAIEREVAQHIVDLHNSQLGK